MIFNLNEQKVLSDPSGSSVFKGEKDFNDIVVNLPDNIDGHTATELNYVMHFVDSDGGYSTKILTVDSSGEALKATATVSTSITSKAQAFYAYVLMTDDEETVIGKTNGVIVMIHPVPDEENEIIPPADADKIIKGLEEIVQEATETIETATDTIEEATEAISSKQDKLTAGENITISSDNVISAEGGGVTSYEDLTDKPTVQVNSSRIVPLSGKLTFTSGFFLANYLPGELIRVDLRNVSRSALESGQNYLVGMQVPSDNHFTAQYDFNNLRNPQADGNMDYKDAGFFKCIGKCLLNTPQIFSSSIGDNSRVMIIHFNTIPINEWYYYLLRVIYFQDSSTNKIRQFAQWIYYESEQNTTVHNVTDWCEIGGNSQIVSGVVNANGTITFTDSDGNTFTTSGSSVIGPQGDDYVLTAQDKSDIADIVLSELPTTQGVLYGNQSN